MKEKKELKLNLKKLPKFKVQSPVTIVLYVFSAIMLIYAIYQIFGTVSSISAYYQQSGSAPAVSEVITYVLQAVVTPLSTAVLLFGVGYVANALQSLIKPAGSKEETAKNKVATKTETVKDMEIIAEGKPEEKTPAAKKTTTKKETAKKPAAKKTTTTKKKTSTSTKKATTKKTTTKKTE